MASREELLQSIKPEMILDKAFFMKVYGYEISFPGFAEISIKALEDAGCSRAREYYTRLVSDYEQKKIAEVKPVSEAYDKKLQKRWEKRIGEEKSWESNNTVQKNSSQKQNEEYRKRLEKLKRLV